MSCCEGKGGQERFPGTGCCGSSCAGSKNGCTASEPRIRSCLCQNNVGCLDRADCGGFRPSGTAATGACPGPCQCAEEEAWNRNIPPKPNCEWLSNFCELRRQWSDHGRQENCKCCNCRSCKIAAPCHPCAPPPTSCTPSTLPPTDCQVRSSRPERIFFKNSTIFGNRQECCDGRLAGGACGSPSITSCGSPNLEEFSPLRSYEGCSPPGSNGQIGKCPPNFAACPPPCPPATRCPVPDPCPIPCQIPSSCKPCAPSPRPILKKRSCCQCIGGSCMCQPMPRNCNCPPPIQVDARSDRECSCDCPSAPECACPPSERRFPRTKVRCPNAKLCCPMPRLPPGPKCCCTQCQPCLPPPCDPCTSTKCRSAIPRVKPCRSDSPCPPRSPCRPSTPPPVPCRPIPPCASCRKMGPRCRTPTLYRCSTSSPTRSLARSSSPGGSSTCSTPCRGSGQSPRNCGSSDHEGDGGDGEIGRAFQCDCGPGGRGCATECDYCCSLNCTDVSIPKSTLLSPSSTESIIIDVNYNEILSDNTISLNQKSSKNVTSEPTDESIHMPIANDLQILPVVPSIIVDNEESSKIDFSPGHVDLLTVPVKRSIMKTTPSVAQSGPVSPRPSPNSATPVALRRNAAEANRRTIDKVPSPIRKKRKPGSELVARDRQRFANGGPWATKIVPKIKL